jgi:hypothetical protein
MKQFDSSGSLPAGVHEMTWPDFAAMFSRTMRRQRLLRGLLEGLEFLHAAGCLVVYVDGSFVTRERWPNDFDTCWEEDGVDIEALDAVFFDFSQKRAAQRARFGGEFFPASTMADHRATFLEFFQRDKQTGQPKGIVRITLETLP